MMLGEGREDFGHLANKQRGGGEGGRGGRGGVKGGKGGEGREDFGHLANKQNHDFGIFDFRILGFWVLGLWIWDCGIYFHWDFHRVLGRVQGASWEPVLRLNIPPGSTAFYPTRNQHRRPTLSLIESTPPRSLV